METVTQADYSIQEKTQNRPFSDIQKALRSNAVVSDVAYTENSTRDENLPRCGAVHTQWQVVSWRTAKRTHGSAFLASRGNQI